MQIPASQIRIIVQSEANKLLRCSNSVVAGSNRALGTDKTLLSYCKASRLNETETWTMWNATGEQNWYSESGREERM